MKILVVGPAWVGDMVMAQSLLLLLHSQHHNPLEIDVLAPEWTLPLLDRMPQVNNSIVMPIGHGKLNLKLRWQLAKKIRANNYDQAIVLPNSFKSSLIPWFAKIPIRTGWRGEARSWILNDCRKLSKVDYPLMVQRFAALALPGNSELPDELPWPELQINQSNFKHTINRLSIINDKPVLALCPGAEYGPSKQWPAEYFSELANIALNKGHQVLVFGSKNDEAIAQEIEKGIIKDQSEQFINLTGKTSLADAIDLLSLAYSVISNDSGLMHVAAALGLPIVVIYGSTSPDFTPPLTKKVKVIKSGMDCSPCFERECPLGHHRCMRDTNPQMVQLALDSINDFAS